MQGELVAERKAGGVRSARPAGRATAGTLAFEADRYVGDDDRDRRLARLVAAGDTDIRVHLERVNRRIEARDADGAYGALVDLFIATGPANSGIRSRATFWAADLLDDERLNALQDAVATGLEASDPMPLAVHSVLSHGVTGAVRLVAPRSSGARVARFPVDGAPDQPVEPTRSTMIDAAWPGATPPPPPAPPATAPPPPPAAPPLATARVAAPVATATVERFDPEAHLIGLLARAGATPPPIAPVLVRGPFGSLVVSGDLVQPDLHAELAPWVTDPLPPGVVELVPAAGRRLDPNRSWPLEDVLWNLTVLAARGRVPHDVPAGEPLVLRRWPNLTRVARLEGDTRLASLLHGGGATLDALLSRAPDRAAGASFVAAAWVTGILVPRAGAGPVADRTAAPPVSAPVLRDLVGRLRRMRRA